MWHHQPEQGTLTQLDVVLSNKKYIRNPEVCEVISVGMGKYGGHVSEEVREPERAASQRVMKGIAIQGRKKKRKR